MRTYKDDGAQLRSRRQRVRLSFHLNFKSSFKSLSLSYCNSGAATRLASARFALPYRAVPCLVSALFALRGAALRSAVSCVVRNVSLTIIMSKIVRCGGGGGYGADYAVAAVLTVTRVFMVIQVSLISRRRCCCCCCGVAPKKQQQQQLQERRRQRQLQA